MATKANIRDLCDAIAIDISILSGDEVGPSGASWQDVAGTLATNLKVLAGALDEQRRGRMKFHGGSPVENLWRVVD